MKQIILLFISLSVVVNQCSTKTGQQHAGIVEKTPAKIEQAPEKQTVDSTSTTTSYQMPPPISEEEMITDIRQRFEQINFSGKKHQQLTLNLSAEKEMTVFYENEFPVKMSVKYQSDSAFHIDEYYMDNENAMWQSQLFFVYSMQKPLPSNVIPPDSTGQRFYFHENQMIRWLDENNQQVDSLSARYQLREQQLQQQTQQLYNAFLLKLHPDITARINDIEQQVENFNKNEYRLQRKNYSSAENNLLNGQLTTYWEGSTNQLIYLNNSFSSDSPLSEKAIHFFKDNKLVYSYIVDKYLPENAPDSTAYFTDISASYYSNGYLLRNVSRRIDSEGNESVPVITDYKIQSDQPPQNHHDIMFWRDFALSEKAYDEFAKEFYLKVVY